MGASRDLIAASNVANPHAMITESTDDGQRRPARAVLRGFAAGDVQIIRSKGRLAVNFELSERQYAFRELMRDFARRSISPVAREMELAGRYPDEIVEEMKAMGLFGMLVPEEHGGIAIDAVSYSIVFEEISKAWMGVAGILGSHSLATLMLARYGTPKQRARWLPDLATGERRSGIALTEPQAGSDLQGIATVARRADDHYVVNGAKTWITNARHADPLPVLVKTDPEAQPRYRRMTILMIDQWTIGFTVGTDMGT